MKKRECRKVLVAMVGMVIMTFCMGLETSNAEPVPGVTDDTILIGLFTALSGPASLFGKAQEMHEAAYLEWGKNIHGRNIRVIKYDDGCEPVKTVATAKKLLYVDNVFLLHGPSCSNPAMAMKSIVANTATPWILGQPPADLIVTPTVKNIFNPYFVASTAQKTVADFAMTIPGVKSVGIIHHTDEWGMSFFKPTVEYLKEKYNMSVAVDVQTERGVADVTPQILKLKAGNVDLVLTITYPAETTSILREAQKLGLDVPIISNTATSVTDQYESLKSLAPLKKFFTPYWCKYPLDHPKVKVWEDLWKKYQPGKRFDAYCVHNTQGALVVMDALRKCGRDLTQEKFIEVLETQYNNWEPENYIGATPLTFSKTRHVGMDRLTMSTIVTGKFEVIKTYQDYEKLIKK